MGLAPALQIFPRSEVGLADLVPMACQHHASRFWTGGPEEAIQAAVSSRGPGVPVLVAEMLGDVEGPDPPRGGSPTEAEAGPYGMAARLGIVSATGGWDPPGMLLFEERVAADLAHAPSGGGGDPYPLGHPPLPAPSLFGVVGLQVLVAE